MLAIDLTGCRLAALHNSLPCPKPLCEHTIIHSNLVDSHWISADSSSSYPTHQLSSFSRTRHQTWVARFPHIDPAIPRVPAAYATPDPIPVQASPLSAQIRDEGEAARTYRIWEKSPAEREAPPYLCQNSKRGTKETTRFRYDPKDEAISRLNRIQTGGDLGLDGSA
ncbi:uncharacterized protein G2W53_021092 [Senna tora]|uniref:Uncharacterized protein n=1 Tax=Senna tora TaxID=362788 RepID=A0A834WJ98_9FABA|nr:uncharacterized protein G2W53_021092 [Senna tora]